MRNKDLDKKSAASLIAKINRKLAKQNQRLHKTRPSKGVNELGDYYIVDFIRNTLVASNVDIEELAAELKLI